MGLATELLDRLLADAQTPPLLPESLTGGRAHGQDGGHEEQVNAYGVMLLMWNSSGGGSDVVLDRPLY